MRAVKVGPLKIKIPTKGFQEFAAIIYVDGMNENLAPIYIRDGNTNGIPDSISLNEGTRLSISFNDSNEDKQWDRVMYLTTTKSLTHLLVDTNANGYFDKDLVKTNSPTCKAENK